MPKIKNEKKTEKNEKVTALDEMTMAVANAINVTARKVTEAVFGESLAMNPALVIDVFERFNHEEDDPHEEELTKDLQLALASARTVFGDAAATSDIVLRFYDHMFTDQSSPRVTETAEMMMDLLEEDEEEEEEEED